ncbi:MAG: glycosyltransferase family 39 protein [Chloroflexi bacterium]|nr:glycosyltransferase family 39 protein [Chloroflexota bacterium]
MDLVEVSRPEHSQARAGRLRWLLVALFFLWLAFTLASYYLVQNALLKPVWLRVAEMAWAPLALSADALVRTVLDLLAAGWIAFVALGSGRWLLDRLVGLPGLRGSAASSDAATVASEDANPSREHTGLGRSAVSADAAAVASYDATSSVTSLETWLFSLGLGFGLLGLVGLALGLAGLLQRWTLAGVMAALTLAAGRPALKTLLAARWPRPGRLVGLYLLLSSALALSVVLLPPTSWDGLFYHLTGPKLYLEAGRIQPGIDIPHLNFPALFGMVFLWGLGLRGEVTAVLLHFLFHGMLAGLVYNLARRLLRTRSGWPAVLFLYATPMVLTLAAWAYNDLALAFYEVAALYALLKWRLAAPEAGRPAAWLALSSVFSGLAMSLKYTSFVAPLALIGLLLWWQVVGDRGQGTGNREQETGNRGRAVRRLLLFGGLAALVALPWYLKNLAFTGNPVYPFVIGGRFWDDFRAAAYAESGTGIAYNPASCQVATSEFLVGQHTTGCAIDPGYLAIRLLALPYELTLGLRDANLLDGITGPFYLVFLPLLLAYAFSRIGRGKPAAFNALLFFALVQFLFWTAGVISSAALWQSRLLLPAFVALCPALAWVLEDLARFDHPRFSLQRQLNLVIGLALLAGLAIQVVNWLPEQPWAYPPGGESRAENLRRRLGAHYLAMEMINGQLPEGAVVAFLWEPRSYYCRRDCRPDSILDTFGHWQYRYGDAAGIATAWQAEGVSHVLLYRAGLEFVLLANSPTGEPLPEPAVLTELIEDHLQLVDTVGRDIYQLYQVKRE